MDSGGREDCSQGRRSPKRDRSGHSRGRSLRRGSQERKRSRRSRSPSPRESERPASQSGSAGFDAWLETQGLPHKLGPFFLRVTEQDGTTDWLDYDDEAMKVLNAGQRMAQKLSGKEYDLEESKKVVTTLQMRASESNPECQQARKEYISGLQRANASLSASIRELKEAITAAKLMLQRKRYKHLYETADRHVCMHKQDRDDREGRHDWGTCNVTGQSLLAEDVASYNLDKPHEIDGDKCTVADTSKWETCSYGPEPSRISIFTWKRMDPDAANQSMNPADKEDFDVIHKALEALESTANKSVIE